MKASMFLALAGLVLLFVVGYASESEEKEFPRELLSKVFAVDDFKGEERGCKGFGDSCTPGKNECCPNYACSSKHKWCKVYLGK
uniref:Hainantoxin-III 7 n=1 Tax=Cyriopagopus hainanus TaxID=2781057 RepID=H3A07_CYRHA|nr:RecName: Full=Hainantoxin-III 7; Short=HnTx-III; AltName: Full=Hainantoxin-3.7; AltName: Full=Mu-theraphotoxin-Hhn2a; Short=Mu-TRTX-Hhn2a; AltName: Full=Peptide F7-18.76; Flags: Precursor [Haplopelma hainanum]ADB56690.1 HNTX-III.7 precursor [Haplopelma hainanum]